MISSEGLLCGCGAGLKALFYVSGGNDARAGRYWNGAPTKTITHCTDLCRVTDERAIVTTCHVRWTVPLRRWSRVNPWIWAGRVFVCPMYIDRCRSWLIKSSRALNSCSIAYIYFVRRWSPLSEIVIEWWITVIYIIWNDQIIKHCNWFSFTTLVT